MISFIGTKALGLVDSVSGSSGSSISKLWYASEKESTYCFAPVEGDTLEVVKLNAKSVVIQNISRTISYISQRKVNPKIKGKIFESFTKTENTKFRLPNVNNKKVQIALI